MTTVHTHDPRVPSLDRLVASVAKFLIEGQDEDVASALLACTVEITGKLHSPASGRWSQVSLTLRGPRAAYDALAPDRWNENPKYQALWEAVAAVLPPT